MKRFQELLMKDIGWKLLSVAIAAIMWFMVININQPVDTRSYSKNIALENMEVLTDRGLTVSNQEELTATKASIKIKAQRTALDRLNQTSDWMTATVDLSALAYAVDGDAVMLPVTVEPLSVYSGYTVVSKSPAVVEVRVEKLASKELPVDVVLNGELPAGKSFAAPSLSNETVAVRGPASAVKRVVALRVTVNAQEVAENVPIRAKLVAYDAQGTPVKGVTTAVSEITVTYDTKIWKKVPIQVNVTGAPAEGFEVGEITCTPQMIEVTGDATALERLMYLSLEAVDLSDSVEGVTKTYVLADYLPQGITVKEGTPATIQVTVEIADVFTREISVAAEHLNVVGGEENKHYSLSGSVRMVLHGDEAELQELQESTISGTVDVSGLTEGWHKAPVSLTLPHGITASEGYIDVTVTENTVDEE